ANYRERASVDLWGAQAASLLSSAACRRLRRALRELPLWNVRRAFRQAAEKDRLPACAPHTRNARDFLVVRSGNHAKLMSNDQIPSPPTGLHPRNIAFVGRKCRSCGDFTAIQSRD